MRRFHRSDIDRPREQLREAGLAPAWLARQLDDERPLGSRLEVFQRVLDFVEPAHGA